MYVFSFRSRTQSMKFYDLLRENNVKSKVINTPREIMIGCGLSVEVSENMLEYAKRVFGYYSYDTFLGLFYVDNGMVKRLDIY